VRKRVTTDTFNQQQYQDGTTLGQSDIICIQEMTTMPGTVTTQQYFPFARDYGVVGNKELTGNIYNAVYFNKEKFSQVAFSQVADWCLTRAYTLMDIKKINGAMITSNKEEMIPKKWLLQDSSFSLGFKILALMKG
jgi:hypothetical protein